MFRARQAQLSTAVFLAATALVAFPAAPAEAQPQVRRVERPVALRQLEVAAVPQKETAALEKVFELGSAFGDRDVFAITLGGPGRIRVNAAWRGTADGLALILNGPGQTGAYARENGASPLRLDFEVTEEL